MVILTRRIGILLYSESSKALEGKGGVQLYLAYNRSTNKLLCRWSVTIG